MKIIIILFVSYLAIITCDAIFLPIFPFLCGSRSNLNRAGPPDNGRLNPDGIIGPIVPVVNYKYTSTAGPPEYRRPNFNGLFGGTGSLLGRLFSGLLPLGRQNGDQYTDGFGFVQPNRVRQQSGLSPSSANQQQKGDQYTDGFGFVQPNRVRQQSGLSPSSTNQQQKGDQYTDGFGFVQQRK